MGRKWVNANKNTQWVEGNGQKGMAPTNLPQLLVLLYVLSSSIRINNCSMWNPLGGGGIKRKGRASYRSDGTPEVASTPFRRRSQNASGLSQPPGKRHAMPTTASDPSASPSRFFMSSLVLSSPVHGRGGENSGS